jgi:thiol:disulfide interchange protein
MKNLITVFFLLFSSSLLMAQDVQFFQGTWQEANALAAKENKLIMVDAYTDWCGPCKQMDKLMFHGNQEVADKINSNFIAYKIDCERDFGLVFSRKFKVMGYPSLLFFNSEGQLIDRKLGFDADQKNFLAGLQAVIDQDPKEVYGYDATKLEMEWP